MDSVPDGNVAKAPVELRQVLYFVTVAEELSFTRAAQRLHISAPALSQQIKALERHVGCSLLVRTTHSVRLTSAGEVFAASGRHLLEQGRLAVVEAQKAASLTTGELRLGSLHEVDAVFEQFLARFQLAFPGIDVTLSSMRHAPLCAALRDRTIDAALTWSFLLERDRGASRGLHWKPMMPAEILAALDPSSALAALDRVPRGEPLRETTAVMFEREYSPITYDYVVEQLYGEDCANPPVHGIQVGVRAQEAMIRHDAGVDAIVPVSRPVADMLRGAREIRPFDPPWILEGCVAWRTADSSPAMMTFLTMVAAESAEVQ